MRPELKIEAKKIAGDIIIQEIIANLEKSRSPVKDGPFKVRKADGTKSQLFDEGDLWESIVYEEHAKGIEVGVFDSDEAPIAYNHNVGDTLPVRQLIPSPDEDFRPAIMQKVNRAINELKSTQKQIVEESETKLTAADLRREVFSNRDIQDFIDVVDIE